MVDTLTPRQRSALMARIRSAGNASTELRLVALLRAAAIRGWRRGQRLPLPRRNEEGRVQKADGRERTTADGDAKNGRGLKRRATPEHPWSSMVQIRRPTTVHRSPTTVHRSPTTGHRSPSTVRTVKPDFVFRRQRLAVFVDGCFWHGCPLHYTRPKTRRAFWDAKIAANKARDRRVDRALRAAGWEALHLWEHALEPRQLGRTLGRIRRALEGRVPLDKLGALSLSKRRAS